MNIYFLNILISIVWIVLGLILAHKWNQTREGNGKNHLFSDILIVLLAPIVFLAAVVDRVFISPWN